MMKGRLLISLMVLLVSCGKSGEEKKTPESSSDISVSTSTFNPGVPSNTGNGPTGVADTVNEEDLEGYTPPVIIPSPPTDPQTGPTLTRVCGVAFASFYDDIVRLYIDDSTTYYVKNKDYSADYFFSSARLTYPNDVIRICADAYIDDDVIHISSVEVVQSSDIPHPQRPLAASFTYEVCGDFSYYTDNSDRTYLEAIDAGVPYIVVDENSPRLELPEFSDSEGTNLAVKGCMYSDEAPYKDYSYTFKKHFKVKQFDFGAQ